MVAFLLDPTIEEEHELNQQPSKLDYSDDPLPLDDCSLSFADSFLDFDSIGDWIEEIPVVDMADSNPDTEKVVDLVKIDVGVVEGFNKDGFCRETNFGDGFQKLGDLGASFEEEIGEISLEEGLNGLIVADTNDKKSPVMAGADGIGVMSGQSVSVKGVETVSVNENGVNSGEIISVDNDSFKSCETLGIDESDKGVEIVGVNENVVNSGEMISVDNGSFRSCKILGIDESGKMGEILAVNGDAKKSDETKSDEDEGEDEDEDESDGSSDSTTESSSSSSSSSSSEEEEDEDDKEEEKMKELKEEIDMEEGEIRDSDVEHMMAGSDNEYDEEDGGDMKGPIKSRNELKVLPPVPPVNVTLQPHHQTQPVGIILSIIGAQVIVEGIEKHNPLNEGSILWITESRSPLGLVDEIFGPVKNPYYMIRYNSDDEVPTGVKTGTSISFVPEFANHVLNDPNLYKKGYDASGDNDEELSDELEFSDDEKEAEYKKMLKMSKRGTNDDPKLGNKKKDGKKFKNRGRTWQNSQPSTPHTQERVHQPPTNQNQHCMPPSAASLEQGNCSHSFGMGQGFAGSPGLGPPFPQLVQAPGFVPPSSVVWTNGMPCQQQQQSMVFPNGVPTNSMPWLQQNNHQQAYQMPLPNIMPFQQHFVPSQGLPSNFILPGAQPNFCAGQSSAPWPAGCLGQTGFNQPFAMGLQFQQAPPMSMNVGEQPRPPVPGNVEDSQKFNHGTGTGTGTGTSRGPGPGPGPGPGRGRGRGRGRGHRGSGRFGGGRGRQQSN